MAVIKNKLEYRRDGSVVLYRRDGRNIWYARFRLPDGGWYRLSTKHTDLKYAADFACEKYDETKYAHKLGVPVQTKRFSYVADLAIAEMEKELEAGHGQKFISFGIQGWHGFGCRNFKCVLILKPDS